MEYDIRLEHYGGQPLAVVRRRASLQDLATVVPAACGTVWAVLRARQVPGAGRHVAVYRDDQINLEVGVEMAAPFAGHGEVVGSAIPSGPVATTTHYGPYSRLHEAHEAIRRWCESEGFILAGPSWEVYDHWKDEYNDDPTKIRTDVFYLLVRGRPFYLPALHPPEHLIGCEHVPGDLGQLAVAAAGELPEPPERLLLGHPQPFHDGALGPLDQLAVRQRLAQRAGLLDESLEVPEAQHGQADRRLELGRAGRLDEVGHDVAVQAGTPE
jgi:hypothetical protein